MLKATEVPADPLESAYAILSGDDAVERACIAIPDAQCTAVPKNFVLNVANGAFTKLAEQLASPTLVLPWLISALGAPAVVVGWLVPVKQAGSLIPQMAVAGHIRGLAQRKWGWVAAGTVQGLSLVAMAAAVLWLSPANAAWALLGLFALFSVASGVGSVAFQDVTGKTIPRGVRGRMLANRAAIGGALTLLAAAGLKYGIGERGEAVIYAALILVAAALWFLAAGTFASIAEEPGAREGGRNLVAEIKAGLRLIREDPGFVRFLGMRIALVLGVELAPPYFAILAQQSQGGGLAQLGLLIFAVGVANIFASWVWGGLADRSARQVCVWAGIAGAAAAVGAILGAGLGDGDLGAWTFGGVFVLAGIAEAGVRLGRKTYLVDAAPKDERPLYTALSNTLAGISALLAGGLGLVAMVTGAVWVVAILLAVCAVGVMFALAMPEAADEH